MQLRVSGLLFGGFAEPQASLALRIRGDEEVCKGEHSRTRGMVPKRLWELEEEGHGASAAIPASVAGCWWCCVRGSPATLPAVPQVSPAGSPSPLGLPCVDAVLSRTVAQLMLSLCQWWAVSPKLPGCDPASLRQPTFPSRAEHIHRQEMAVLPWAHVLCCKHGHCAAWQGETSPPNHCHPCFPILTCRMGLRSSPSPHLHL